MSNESSNHNQLEAIVSFIKEVFNSDSFIPLHEPKFHGNEKKYIGDRQKGRLKADSVIDCEPTIDSIQNAVKKLYSKFFIKQLQSTNNPYNGVDVAEKIVDIIKSFSLDNILKKSFYDLN